MRIKNVLFLVLLLCLSSTTVTAQTQIEKAVKAFVNSKKYGKWISENRMMNNGQFDEKDKSQYICYKFSMPKKHLSALSPIFDAFKAEESAAYSSYYKSAGEDAMSYLKISYDNHGNKVKLGTERNTDYRALLFSDPSDTTFRYAYIVQYNNVDQKTLDGRIYKIYSRNPRTQKHAFISSFNDGEISSPTVITDDDGTIVIGGDDPDNSTTVVTKDDGTIIVNGKVFFKGNPQVVDSEYVQKQIDSFRKAVKDYEKAIVDYKDGIKEYEDGIKQYEKDIDELRKEQKDDEYEMTIKNYEDAVSNFKRGIENFNNGIKNSETAIENFQDQIARLKQQLLSGVKLVDNSGDAHIKTSSEFLSRFGVYYRLYKDELNKDSDDKDNMVLYALVDGLRSLSKKSNLLNDEERSYCVKQLEELKSIDTDSYRDGQLDLTISNYK
ncbi:MAG: hypothetical protein ACOYJG_06010 [Prevotella sp.]